MRKYDNCGRTLLLTHCYGKGLDIGCNELKITPDCIGVDIDPDVNPDVIATMDALPWDDNDMDFVVSSHCLEHCTDVIATLREWCRILKPGGSIGVCVPHGEHVCSATLGDASGTHRQLFTPITLKLYLEHCGFINVQSWEYDRPEAYQQTPGIYAAGVKA